jgi:cyclin-dependent kinase regulatory subunit CKS1
MTSAAAPHRDIAIYSDKFADAVYEYRHVFLTTAQARVLHPPRLFHESEWRAAGLSMSYGWEHYAWHAPERSIFLVRRELDYAVRFGCVERPGAPVAAPAAAPVEAQSSQGAQAPPAAQPGQAQSQSQANGHVIDCRVT